jgi:hypothetical protein
MTIVMAIKGRVDNLVKKPAKINILQTNSKNVAKKAINVGEKNGMAYS